MLNGSMIIEKITNSNGTAIKFEDGTMICYGQKSGTSEPLADYYGFCKRTNPTDITFTEIFTDVPKIIMSNSSSGGTISNIIGTITNSGFAFYILKAPASTNASYEISYIAIGTWK